MVRWAIFFYRVFSTLCNSKKQQTESFERITRPLTEWNSPFFAPAVEKALDGIILCELLKKYPPADSVLAEAVNQARFEEVVLADVIEKRIPIDVLDLGIQFDFDREALEKKQWIRTVYITSFDNPPIPLESYSTIICNNGYAASENITGTLASQKSSLKKEGLLIFNMHLPSYNSDAFRVFKLHSIFTFNRKASEAYKEAENNRLRCNCPEKELDKAIINAGFEIVEKVYYLRGAYQLLSSFFLYPVYMKYFGVMKEIPDQWPSELSYAVKDFNNKFPFYSARLAQTQFAQMPCLSEKTIKQARKIYYVVKPAHTPSPHETWVRAKDALNSR